MAVFASGTKTFFTSTNAPPGWTKDATNYNEYTLRVVNGATTSSGGSTNFTSVFTSRTISGTAPFSSLTSGSTTLNPTNLPAHIHQSSGGATISSASVSNSSPASFPMASTTPVLTNTGANGTQGAHSHPFGTIGVSISGALDLSVQYVDLILATKN